MYTYKTVFIIRGMGYYSHILCLKTPSYTQGREYRVMR